MSGGDRRRRTGRSRPRRAGSEKRLEAILDAALDAVVSMDAAGVITSWNAPAEAMFGWPSSEAVGRTLADTVIPARNREAHRRGLARFLATGKGRIVGRRVEMDALHRDGHEFPVELTVAPIRLGDTWLFSAFVRDMTEPKRAEEIHLATLRISDAAHAARNLQELFHALHEIVAGLMPAKNFYIALYDAPTETIAFPYFVDEYDQAFAPKKLGRGLTEYVLRTGRPLLATPDVFRALEERGEVELIGAPSVDWLGVPLKIGEKTIGVLVVQTYAEGVRYGETEEKILQFVSTQMAMVIDRKRAEEELRGNRDLLRAVIEGSFDSIFAKDLEGRYLLMNSVAARAVGRTLDTVIGQRDDDLFPPEMAHRYGESDRRVVSSGAADTFEDVDQVGRPQLVMKAPLRDGTGKIVGVLGIARDMTERKRLEEQMRQSQRLEAVGRLAGGVAHDFNNLLTAILGSTDLILESPELDHALREDVGEIRRASLRAADLTRQLLAFSRRQLLQPELLDLNTVVADMDKLLRRLIGEDVALRTVLAASLRAVRADPGQIEQVIANLSVNARDAMPRGGALTLETANVEVGEAEAAERSALVPGEYVKLVVSDTGSGMDVETRSHLFEPFFTTKRKGEGTGLGLATVYGIVKQSGGYVYVDSEPGRGTTVTIFLPAVAAATMPPAPRLPPAASHRGAETILVVEDEEAVRKLTRRLLEARGYTVLAAASGGEALSLVERYAGGIALLVSDVVMPGMSGPEVVQRVCALRPETKALLVSGYTDDAMIRHGVRDSGIAFLQKPFTPDALARKVRELLDEAG
ncbi:MAG: PAS domain S-box protein [Gemmatimonadetes bacterium]|nr:PAS domain S-box protein [Gemmatimonadota bacterium]